MKGTDGKSYTKARDMRGMPVSENGCPMDNCNGYLTVIYQINDEPQWAIACTRCSWWILAEPRKGEEYFTMSPGKREMVTWNG